MEPRTVLLLCAMLALGTEALSLRPRFPLSLNIIRNGVGAGAGAGAAGTALFAAGVDIERDLQFENAMRTWYLLQHGVRAEVFQYSASDRSGLISDVWRSVMVGGRVLDSDLEATNYLSVNALPFYPLGEAGEGDDGALLRELDLLAVELVGSLVPPSSYVEPELTRTIKFHLAPAPTPSAGPSGLVLCYALLTKRPTMLLDFSDMDVIPEDFEVRLNNTIAAFPFPSVYDFIAEINRPQDPLTMSTLRHNFQPQDFKFDLKKMAKRKNPQEVVDLINCKLTRLENWKDVLQAHHDGSPNPFLDAVAWSSHVKEKYRTLKYLAATDTRKAIDTQYDRRGVFLKLIEQWSDRLKRNFKFIYQAKKQVDFQEVLRKAPFRAEMRNLISLYSEVPFLQFPVPPFPAGLPDLTSQYRGSGRGRVMDTPDFSVPDVDADMRGWLGRINAVQRYASTSFSSTAGLGGEGFRADSSASMPSQRISLNAYSRAYNTDRLLMELWASIGAWASAPSLPSASAVAETDTPACAASVGAPSLDHHDSFLASLSTINTLSRQQSQSQAKAVRDLYRGWAESAAPITDWWGNLVSELNLDDEMDKIALTRQRAQENMKMRTAASTSISTSALSTTALAAAGLGQVRSWTEVVQTVVEGGSNSDEAMSSDDFDIAERNAVFWDQYRPLVQTAESLQAAFPWTVAAEIARTTAHAAAAPASLPASISFPPLSDSAPVPVDYTADLVLVPQEGEGEGEEALLFVLPRQFRGIGDQELVDFLEFCACVEQQLPLFQQREGTGGSGGLRLVPLHPLMVDPLTGAPDHLRRAPYPALLLYGL
ncbi:hypothetical protein B484DRAFT_418502 [Ochromonadaceae sp. CCMP2298]|nr:hypothetical protein B484DRAFT_418502 [Ochromonadaceae sp. CCMP2298]